MSSRCAIAAFVFVIFFCLAGAMAQQKTPAKKGRKNAPDKSKILAEPIPGYRHVQMEGFDLLVNKEVFEHNDDREYERKPLAVLELEIQTIVRILPPRTVTALRQIIIWIEWHDRTDPDLGRAVAKFYGFQGDRAFFVLHENKHPLKANNVEVITMKTLTEEHQPDVKLERCVLLHELAHAVHHHVFDFDNPHIKSAYAQAMTRRLYETSTDVYGRTIEPYAAANDAEYFAELTCAYLNKLHYFPNNADDLKQHDPVGHRMMELTWGTKKDIALAIRAELERYATGQLSAARKILIAGKKSEAFSAFQKITESYPETKAAAEAKVQMEKLAKAGVNPADAPRRFGEEPKPSPPTKTTPGKNL